MRLTPPKKIVFYAAAALMLFGLIAYFAINEDLAFWVETAGGVLLALSVSLKGL